MNLVTGIFFNKDVVLSEILKQLKIYFNLLESKDYGVIKAEYESLLFRLDKPSTFQTLNDENFSGIIKGITETGLLKVWTEDETIKTFDLKEIKLLY